MYDMTKQLNRWYTIQPMDEHHNEARERLPKHALLVMRSGRALIELGECGFVDTLEHLLGEQTKQRPPDVQ